MKKNPFIGGIFLSHHFTQIHTLINPDGLNIREEIVFLYYVNLLFNFTVRLSLIYTVK